MEEQYGQAFGATHRMTTSMPRIWADLGPVTTEFSVQQVYVRWGAPLRVSGAVPKMCDLTVGARLATFAMEAYVASHPLEHS